MNTPFHLNGRKILITGATGGIGKETARLILEMGGNVILTGRNAEQLQAIGKELNIPGQSLIGADLTTTDGREHLAKNIPSIDGLVHCAGTVHPFPIRFLTEEKLRETMEINFDAPVLMTALFLKAKKINPGASLVFLSSISAGRPLKGATTYGGSKAGLESFVKVLAQEVAGQKIRANTISPAMVRTPMYERAEEMVTKEEMDKHAEKYLIGVGEPNDVANAAVFLLSSASRWITGINLILDGGILL